MSSASVNEQRRDLLLRTVVDQCERRLEPHGFQLLDRGRIDSLALVGLRRPADLEAPVTDQAAAVVGHDPESRLLLARLYGWPSHPDVDWSGKYESAADLANQSQHVVRIVAHWTLGAAQSAVEAHA